MPAVTVAPQSGQSPAFNNFRSCGDPEIARGMLYASHVEEDGDNCEAQAL